LPRETGRDGFAMSVQAIRDDLAALGARLIAPPVLQPADLYLELAGEDIRRRAFMVAVDDGPDLCLRPDMTVPACRMALADGLTPSILAYEGQVFRRQADGSAKESEFSQIGAEWCGLAHDPAAIDADVLSAALRAVRGFGVEPRVRMGDVALFLASAEALGWPAAWRGRLARGFQRPDGVSRVIAAAQADAAASAPPQARGFAGLSDQDAQSRVRDALSAQGIVNVGGRPLAAIAARLIAQDQEAHIDRPAPDACVRLAQALAIDAAPIAALDQLERLLATAPSPGAAAAALAQARRRVAAVAEVLPADSRFSIGFGRGLAYYDGAIFELEHPPLGALASLGGGGRYDGLLAALSKDPRAAAAQCAMTAAGFAVRPARLEMARLALAAEPSR
jgi:ATP phosphoribosyltransferase regulatory subunit